MNKTEQGGTQRVCRVSSVAFQSCPAWHTVTSKNRQMASMSCIIRGYRWPMEEEAGEEEEEAGEDSGRLI
jgi:hypothetical protein